ncbi:hypothetical protein N8083_00745 [Candidatus Pacebacteria bacterium]|nr:hypothetical protein [Candidatus Paceibacterota bacterium]
MANLIPPDAKHAIIVEYWTRVVTVWFVLIGCALIVVAILKLPTFVLVNTQLNAFKGAYNDARVKEDTFLEVQKTLIEANELSNLLSGYEGAIELTNLLGVLDTIAGTEVSISDFKFEKTETALTKITIVGFANTRIALADFSKNIEAHVLFSEAALPISSLAKDKDISFSLEIVPTTQ